MPARPDERAGFLFPFGVSLSLPYALWCCCSGPWLGWLCCALLQLAEVTDKVRQVLDKNGFPKTTPVIATSAKSRQGRVELLGYLRLVFDVDRRKGKGGNAVSSAGGGAEAAVV